MSCCKKIMKMLCFVNVHSPTQKFISYRKIIEKYGYFRKLYFSTEDFLLYFPQIRNCVSPYLHIKNYALTNSKIIAKEKNFSEEKNIRSKHFINVR